MNKKNNSRKLAIVTGGNRGIGFEICRQLAQKGIHVILTSRTKSKGEEAVAKLQKEGLNAIDFFQLDVSKEESIKKLAKYLKNKNIDILINNAGVLLDRKENKSTSIFHAKIKTIEKTFKTNTLGPLLMCNYLIPLMKKNNYGRIVNISSGMGQINDMYGEYPAYRISKISLNALTKIYAYELKESNILINSMCPGWVRTSMGGNNATRTVKRGAQTAIWLATLPNNGASGKFFRDNKEIPW